MTDQTEPGHDDPEAGEPTQTLAASPTNDPTPEPKPWYKNPAVVIPLVIGLVLIGLLAAFLVGNDSDDSEVKAADRTPTTGSATSSSSSSTAGSPSPDPAQPEGQPAPEGPTPGNGNDCFDGEECLTDAGSTFTDVELDGILEAVRGQYSAAAADCPGAGDASQVYGETTIEFSGTAEGFVEGFAIWEGNATVPFSYDTNSNSVDFTADVCVGLGE